MAMALVEWETVLALNGEDVWQFSESQAGHGACLSVTYSHVSVCPSNVLLTLYNMQKREDWLPHRLAVNGSFHNTYTFLATITGLLRLSV